jgi:multiple sugar transport system substrate-binding protein
VALPWYYIPACMTYREDLYKQHGFPPPKTWEEWKETGKKIKAASGHKVGIALSQTEDANTSYYPILWTHGASVADKEQRVIINSPGTRQAMDYVKDLYESCMTNEVLSWDDSSNNQAFMGGTYAWVHNAVSIYYVAKEKVPDIAQVTSHTLSPAGPDGEHGAAVPINYGIWQFAQEKELAKQFLQYLMDLQRLEENFQATLTYNAPTYKAGDKFDWGKDPKTGMLKDFAKTAHLIGWPGPADRKAEQARAEWIVPNMFTYYATGQKSLDESVTWAEGELRRIYAEKA